MAPRFLILIGLVALVGTGCRNQGAVKVTVAFPHYTPHCLLLTASDGQSPEHSQTNRFLEKLEGKDAEHPLTVAVYREASWGNTLTLTVQAYEQPLSTDPLPESEDACPGKPVGMDTQQITVHQGDSAKEVALTLATVDGDGDGYVAVASGGSDCDDTPSGAPIHPDQSEQRCDGQDDNCNGLVDEGITPTWFHDVDGDKWGSPLEAPLTGCTQPAGYVDNNQDCDDHDARRHPGNPELCNGVDDNCNSQVDEGLGNGDSCTGAGGCPGTNECDTDGGVRCNSPTPQYVYADTDHDNHGAADASLTLCGTSAPANYVTSSDDCDDTHKTVYPGAPEICDGLDNNCNGTTDEGFSNLGTPCAPGYNCPGKIACLGDGGSGCTFTTSPSTWYLDEDLDSYGRTDAGVMTCTPDAGYVLDAGDCDDGNPFTYPGAPELCDLDDNNCDGKVDESPACLSPDGGSADGGQWVSMNTGITETFRSVSLWGDGGVWVAGASNVLRMLPPGGTAFTSMDTQCTGDWYGVWAQPTDPYLGSNVLVGSNTVTAYHGSPPDTTCIGAGTATDTNAKGVFTVPLAGTLGETHLVGGSISNTNLGHALWGNSGGFSFKSGATSLEPLYDIHGLSRELLFAVGGANNSSRVYRFKSDAGTSGDWVNETLPASANNPLRGIWVVHSKLAYAVGLNNTIFVWNGTTWSTHPAPTLMPKEDLLSVVAFGKNSIYVTTGSGKVLRFGDNAWTVMPGTGSGNPLNDIAATHPGNLWVVGGNGALLHWPR